MTIDRIIEDESIGEAIKYGKVYWAIDSFEPYKFAELMEILQKDSS